MMNSPYRDEFFQTRSASRSRSLVRVLRGSRLFRTGLLLCLAVCCGLCSPTPSRHAVAQEKKAKPPALKYVDLINPKTWTEDWQHVSAKLNSPLGDTWKVDNDPKLICSGQPGGYLRTKKAYENYELKLEWMYHDDSCNSGILIHVHGKDKVWPDAIQVQLHRPKLGSIFPTGDAKLPSKLKRDGQMLPVKVWHRCTITCRNGSITVAINDKKIGEVTGCNPAKGHIAFQSEASVIHFRKIRIHEFKPKVMAKKKPKAKKTAPKKKTPAD